MQVQGLKATATVTLSWPQPSEASTDILRTPPLGKNLARAPSKGTPLSQQGRARPADVVSVCVTAASRPELLAASLLFLFVFTCHVDRRGKGKRIFGFVALPCLMWLRF